MYKAKIRNSEESILPEETILKLFQVIISSLLADYSLFFKFFNSYLAITC